MARPTSREEILQHARYLIRGGVPRRRMDTILREKYGRSIGHVAHTTLFRERVTEIRERVRREPRGFKAPRTRRQRNYNYLSDRYFLPEEAKELTLKLNTLNIHEIDAMVLQRANLAQRFLRRTAENVYTRAEFRREWRRTVKAWYRKNRATWRVPYETWFVRRRYRVTRKRLSIDIWGWYGYVKQQLPPELQYDTPRKHRRKSQAPVTVQKITRSQELNNLRRLHREETDPRKKAMYGDWIREKEAGMRSRE